ncbi:hypothetical protein H257_03211 [Aphanomyces astaci]|uniref:Tc1-like transposase DDE domain-containing protein n=1 Tax=Aphanomyces astaci TaxID=112090 RepID=W4H1M3_APHAT|nr:hypothetical protein H257_03211 [Aphanomyces astaci]ETV85481.1 hypothetical protein H257_03211 [Aphanomyces astaci]|eukprot:XP_009825499.1 hypothetical protein H257_03211 [Aphanomyces astaci]
MTTERRNLTNEEREAILREVLLHSNGSYLSRLPKGLSQELTVKYSCHVATIRRVLAVAKQQGVGHGNMKVTVASRKKGRVGRKKAFIAEQVKAKLLQVPLAERTTLRSIAERTWISLGSLHRYLKLGMFRSHSNAITPFLTDANKYSRMKYAVEFVGPTQELNNLLQYVHLDEKWFYITKERRKFYLVPGEKEPKRVCKSKRYITKVMFLCAVARPRYVHGAEMWWDGKIGIWPIVESVQAQRASVNRPAGTLETKSITVTKEVYRTFLLDKVLPAIVAKWPRGDDRAIKLQHDNARAHATPSDAKLKAALVMKLFGDNAYKVPHMSKRKEERRGLLPQNVTCPRDFFDAARAKLDGMASSELDRVLAAELKEARCADELAQVLEAIIVAIALSDDESDDMISAMAEVGIDPVWKMTSMRSYMYACWYCGWSLCSLGGFLR